MKKKIIMIFTLLCILLTGMNAFAKPLKFEIRKEEGAKAVETNTKDLDGNVWKITNSNGSFSNFVSNNDVVGFRTRDENGKALSEYHTFSRFVYRYELKYTTVPQKGAPLKLHVQIDSTSKSTQTKFEGEWIS